jgi:hypothetical protein
MDSLFALLCLASLILLIIGLFSPKASLFWDKKERTRKKSALVYGGLMVLFFIFFGVSNDRKLESKSAETVKSSSSTQTTDLMTDKTETEKTSSLNAEEPKQEYKKIGDQVEIGNFSYLVKQASFAKAIGNEFMKKTADGLFLVVNVSFRNNDNEEHTLDNSLFKLTDENGTEFESSSEGETALEMSGKSTLFLKQCNPNITKSGFLVFEVPEDKKIYDLHLSGGYWSGKTAVVKLTTNQD